MRRIAAILLCILLLAVLPANARAASSASSVSVAATVSADGSCQVLNSSFAQWHQLSVDWLYRIFGALQFVDKSTSKMGKYLAELGITMPGGPAPKHG